MEDSSVDILLVTEKSAQNDATQLSAIYSNIDMSNYYIKVKMITDELVGNQVMAASMRCVVTLLNDRKIVVQGGASSQNAFHGL